MKGVDIFIRPFHAGLNIRRNPHWLGSVALLCITHVLVFVIVYPHATEVMMRHLPASVTSNDLELIASTMRAELPLQSFFLPFRILFGCYLFSLFLYHTCRAFQPPEPVRFVHVFSGVVLSEFILLGNNLSVLVRVLLADSDSAAESFFSPLGAGSLAGNVLDFTIASALNQINFFAGWNLLALSAIISGVTGFRFVRAFLITFLVVTVVFIVNIGITRLLYTGLSLKLWPTS